MNIFIHRNGEQEGPYTMEELRGIALTPQTMVWYSGLNNWQRADEAPLTAVLFAPPQPPQPQQPPQPPYGTYVPPMPGYNQQYTYPPQYVHTAPVNEAPGVPNNYIGWVITVLLLSCCCFLPLAFPFGIVAAIYALQVRSKYDAGDYEGAQKASRMTSMWLLIAVGAGVIGTVIGMLIQSIN